MKPMLTTYRLARPGGEFNKLYAMTRRVHNKTIKMQWPVVVAVRNGEVLGFLGTEDRDDAVFAGPLVIKNGPNPFLFLRLVEAYERVLTICGIKSYFFDVLKGNFNMLVEVKALNITPVAETEDTMVFKRELQ